MVSTVINYSVGETSSLDNPIVFFQRQATTTTSLAANGYVGGGAGAITTVGQLQLALAYNRNDADGGGGGVLSVHVLSARGLPPRRRQRLTDAAGANNNQNNNAIVLPNAFVRLRLLRPDGGGGGDEHGRPIIAPHDEAGADNRRRRGDRQHRPYTGYVASSAEPVWNQRFELALDADEELRRRRRGCWLEAAVWDYERSCAAASVCVGRALVELRADELLLLLLRSNSSAANGGGGGAAPTRAKWYPLLSGVGGGASPLQSLLSAPPPTINGGGGGGIGRYNEGESRNKIFLGPTTRSRWGHPLFFSCRRDGAILAAFPILVCAGILARLEENN